VRPPSTARHYETMEETYLRSCVRGFHVYSTIWNPTLGEILPCRRELTNVTDRYAVAVLESGTIVGHLPRKFSKIFSLFIRRGGNITCEITGRRRYSRDLVQGGMEVPCKLVLRSTHKEVKKFKILIARRKK